MGDTVHTPRNHTPSGKITKAAVAALFGLAALAPYAPAQPATASRVLAAREQALGLSRAQTLLRLETRVETKFVDHPLHDVVRYLSLVADVPLQPLWMEDSLEHDLAIGLDPMTPITLNTSGLTVLQALESAIDIASDAQRLEFGATWQFGPTGIVELGPHERLNRAAACRTEVYDVQDLLTVLPECPDAPKLDASTAGQPLVAGSGAEQWTFPSDNTLPSSPSRSARASDLRGLILAMVEPAHWAPNGGPATIEIYEGALIVHAPDYIHRALVGPLSSAE